MSYQDVLNLHNPNIRPFSCLWERSILGSGKRELIHILDSVEYASYLKFKVATCRLMA